MPIYTHTVYRKKKKKNRKIVKNENTKIENNIR